MTTETGNGVAVNNYGAVMSDGMGVENALKERLADCPVQFCAAAEVSVEGVAPLNDDYGAYPVAGKIRHGLNNDLGCVAVRNGCLNLSSDSPQNGKALKEPPEIFLKDDNKNENKYGKETLQDNCGKIKLEKSRNDIDKSRLQIRAGKPSMIDIIMISNTS